MLNLGHRINGCKKKQNNNMQIKESIKKKKSYKIVSGRCYFILKKENVHKLYYKLQWKHKYGIKKSICL